MGISVSDNIYSVCLEVFGSIHELRAEIDNTVRSKSIDGLILLDTLFHSGNGDDRFIVSKRIKVRFYGVHSTSGWLKRLMV